MTARPLAIELRHSDDVLPLEACLASRPAAEIGAPARLALLSGLGRRLLRPDVRRAHPELAALGYFLRPAGLGAMVDTATSLVPSGCVRRARGVVFHVPPANVDTLFAYSWAISVAMGNHNVVRLSSRSNSTAGAMLLQSLQEAFAELPELAETQHFVRYGRDDSITRSLSGLCDLRVLWGGDESIVSLREVPLRAHARDLTFGTRTSLAALGADEYLRCGEEQRTELAARLANDIFWFRQQACSSPLRLVLVTNSYDVAQAAAAELASRVDAASAAFAPLDAAERIERSVSVSGLALDGELESIEQGSGSLLTAWRPRAVRGRLAFVGTGVLQFQHARSVAELSACFQTKDQTLAVDLLSAEALGALATHPDTPVDRIVRIGSALSFSQTWDGYWLPGEFSRLVDVRINAKP